MRFFQLASVVLCSLTSLVCGQDTDLNAVRRAFQAANIPQNLSITFNPKVLLEVTFPQTTGRSITLHAGIQLPRNATAGPPTFSIGGGSAGKGPFVVAAVDPDAPTPQTPTSAQIRHFLGSDFVEGRNSGPGSGQFKPLVNNTAAISPFRQPNPPAGSDAHRYIFLLFNQPPGFDQQTLVNSTTPVSLFNISSFAEATRLGSPVAGTFMLVAPDPPATAVQSTFKHEKK